MLYIIVSSSRCDYQAWQLRLLDWSRKKAKQPGKLIILLSEDEIHKNESTNIDFDQDDDVELISLPDWAHKWKEEHDDWWGGIPNKYESFNWIAEFYPFEKEDVLLFLDPDMIFLEPVVLKPKEKEIIGQQWIGYRSLDNWPQKEMAFMYPFALRFDTLQRIKDDFKQYCFRIRKEIKAWESDMWALDYAADNNGISVNYIPRLGVCTAWRQNEGQEPSPIIHFPNIIESEKGKKIFFKQDYTFHQDQNIEIHTAKHQTDKQLLVNISQERTDFIYHLKWNFDNLFKGYNGDKGTLILKPWSGGFNNIRMSLELAVCLAYLSNRSLVLPPTYEMYLLEGSSNLSDFFDVDNLGIKRIEYSAFCNENGIEVDDKKVRNISKIVDYDCVANIVNFEKMVVPEWFTKGRTVLDSREIFDDSDHLYLDGNLLGSFYQCIYSSKDEELKKLIANHVVYRSDIFNIAWEFINYIGDLTYYAIHIRRNDFQYKDLFISCEEIAEKLLDIVPIYSTLYIATDHRDSDFFKPLAEQYTLVFYQEIADRIDTHPKDVNLIPIIEQFICTRAIKFVGMKLSTLSSYIFRMRGYMDDISDNKYYLNGEAFSAIDQCDFKEDNRFIANWAREYKCSWNFKKETIFVSIASFMDTQLDETIKSAIECAADISRVVFGVHLQDTTETYQTLLAENYPNLKVKFTNKEDAKGVVWARNCIKRELFDGEDFFLQIDAHSRFKQNWDNILVNQYHSIESPNAVITTYPNSFEISDNDYSYLKLENNSPLIIRKFLTDNREENRLRPGNSRQLNDYELKPSNWCAAGFVFAPGRWVKDIELSDEIIFNGEEDLMTHLSFLRGYNLLTPSECCVWHNYNFKNEETGIRYKEFNPNLKGDNSMKLVNHHLFGYTHKGERTFEDLEKFLNWKFKPVFGYSNIFVTIAAYMDLDVRETIESCLKNAKYPNNLSFGVCWQYDISSHASETYLDDLTKLYSIQLVKYDHLESKGVGWARNEAAKFYQDEKYILQIDSHSRFRENWDQILIDNITNLKKVSEKPIISCFPLSFSLQGGHNMELEFNGRTDIVHIPEIINITEEYLFDYNPKSAYPSENKSYTIPTLEPSFIFAEGTWARNVSPDPSVYYMGEEVLESLRAFTHGYDFFTPEENVLWHRSDMGNMEKHYESQHENIVKELHQKSMSHIETVIRGDGDHPLMRLGTHRTLAEYEVYASINFNNKNVFSFKRKSYEFKKEPFKLGLITRCKDEFFIKEFCNYYLNQGVDQIHIIDDDSDDKSIYDGILGRDDIVIHFEKNITNTKYVNHLYRIVKDNFEWMIYVDVDEFITTKKDRDRTILDVLENEFKDVHCVKIPWVMMSPNGLQKSPKSILENIIYRWDHDKKHENKKSKHRKFRCRYDKIESKCIFKTSIFSDVFDHHPTGLINNSENRIVESIRGTPTKLNSYYDELRDEDIRTGILLCYHYRIISEEQCRNKLITNVWYSKGYTLEDLLSTDFPEVLDETLKTKSLDYRKKVGHSPHVIL